MRAGTLRNLRRAGWLVVAAFLVAWSLHGTEFDAARLKASIPRGLLVVRAMFPPDWKLFYQGGLTHHGALGDLQVTVQMALLGTLIGFLLAMPVSFFAARSGVIPRPLSSVIKAALNVLRAIPPFVYAVIFVYMVGLGPFTGALGIGVGSFVFLAKLFAESLESVSPAPIEAVKAVGGNSLQVFAWGMLPQALPQFLSHTLYAWEFNIGAATIVGIVGAGGIGQELISQIHYNEWPKVCTYLLVLVVLVLITDMASYQIRKRII